MSSSSWFVALRRPAPADFERWLEAKAADGQVLTEYSTLSPLRMKFTDSAPAQVRYAVERRASPAPIDYYRFREQQGWEHVGHAADFHIWSRTYTDERPAGFIGEDLDHRASRLGVLLGIVAALALILTVGLAAASGLAAAESIAVDFWAPAIVSGVVFLIAGCGTVALAVSARKGATPDHRPEREPTRV
ncbi:MULTISPECIES: DUF2812 domain-containing protein [Gordonia]|uniref:DUF2812 domain-containing protein n=1 Tax=Gordonia TaxID=2053 RepID=UPI003264B757